MAKISFENLYRKIVNGFNESPPESVWQNIQDNLDIDEVWSQIDNKLPVNPIKSSYSPVTQIINYVLFFLLLFFFKSNTDQPLLPLDGFLSSSEDTSFVEENMEKEVPTQIDKDENFLAAKKEIKNDEIKSKTAENRENTFDQNSISVNSKPTSNLVIKNPIKKENDTVDVIEAESIVNQKIEETYYITRYAKLNYLVPLAADFESTLIATVPKIKRIEILPSTDTTKNIIPFIKFSGIGIVGNMKNSWIINNATRASFNNEALINTEASYTNDFGISSQFEMRSQQIIQLSYWFSAKHKQNYFQYYNANYTKKEFNIAYQSFSIDFLQPLFSSKSYLILGFQLAKIGSVQETLAGNLYDLSDNYSDWNYGVDLGLQRKFNIRPKLSFQPALRLHYGLRNIFNGNEFIPKEFDYTRPASISLDLRFLYHFIK